MVDNGQHNRKDDEFRRAPAFGKMALQPVGHLICLDVCVPTPSFVGPAAIWCFPRTEREFFVKIEPTASKHPREDQSHEHRSRWSRRDQELLRRL